MPSRRFPPICRNLLVPFDDSAMDQSNTNPISDNDHVSLGRPLPFSFWLAPDCSMFLRLSLTTEFGRVDVPVPIFGTESKTFHFWP